MIMSPVWTRFVRFIAEDRRELCGQPEDDNLDVGLALAETNTVIVKVLDTSSALDTNARFTGERVSIKKLLSPISAKEIGTVRCIGMNYKDHVKEMGSDMPKVPEVFMKAGSSVIDPSEPIVLPTSASNAVDGECELTIVIGKNCKNATVDNAWDYILGYTAANDVTARDVQARISQWGYAKGYDTFCPIGPCIVSSERIPDPSTLKLKTTVNGKTLQDGRSKNLIFTIPEIIEYLSRGTTLLAGTVILTGTPAGIGHSHNPPLYLSAGAVVRVGISGGIGTLCNEVVLEA